VGLTASSVASVSLAPPAIVASVSQRSGAAPALLAARSFVVHLLEARNVELARLFATPGADRFDAVTDWTALDTGEPWLPAAPVALRCRPLALVPVGDATVITAEVVGIRATPHAGAALVHHARRYHLLGEPLPEPVHGP